MSGAIARAREIECRRTGGERDDFDGVIDAAPEADEP